jgi:flagellar motility protein MotE (MotC chaperone)
MTYRVSAPRRKLAILALGAVMGVAPAAGAVSEVQPPLAGEQEAPLSPEMPPKQTDISALLEPPAALAESPERALAPATPLGADGAPCQMDPAELKVLLALRERRLALDGRERAVLAREAELRAAQAKLDGRIAAIDEGVQRLEARLELGEPGRKAHEQRLRDLADSLGSLSAKQAAPILAEADPTLTAELLQRLGTTRTAALLAAMTTGKAAKVVNITGGPRQPGVRPAPAPAASAPIPSKATPAPNAPAEPAPKGD